MGLDRAWFTDNTTELWIGDDDVMVIRDVMFRGGHSDTQLFHQAMTLIEKPVIIEFPKKVFIATADIVIYNNPGKVPVESTWSFVRNHNIVSVTVTTKRPEYVADRCMYIPYPTIDDVEMI